MNSRKTQFILICLCTMLSFLMYACTKKPKKTEVEVTKPPVVVETKVHHSEGQHELIFTIKQPITEEYAVLYTGTCVVDDKGDIDKEMGLAIFTAIMKKDTLLANDKQQTGIANIDGTLTADEQGRLHLVSTVSYDKEQDTLTFHYIKSMTLRVKKEKHTYSIILEDYHSA